jgi:hypothetical protein
MDSHWFVIEMLPYQVQCILDPVEKISKEWTDIFGVCRNILVSIIIGHWAVLNHTPKSK